MATAPRRLGGDVARLPQREVATAQQREAHGLEVAGGDDVVLGVDLVVLGGAGQSHCVALGDRAEGHVRRQRRRDHAGLAAQPVEHAAVEIDRARLVEARERGVELHQDPAVDGELGLVGAGALRAAHEQPSRRRPARARARSAPPPACSWASVGGRARRRRCCARVLEVVEDCAAHELERWSEREQDGRRPRRTRARRR